MNKSKGRATWQNSLQATAALVALAGIAGCSDQDPHPPAPVVTPPPVTPPPVTPVTPVAVAPVQLPPLYANNFEKSEVGKTPDDLLILDGTFEVAQEEANRVLALPVQGLEEHGFMCGPARADGVEIVVRIRAEKLKRQYPQMGVGLYGRDGLRLKFTAASGEVALTSAQGSLAKATVAWTSGAWMWFKLRAELQADGTRQVRGKVWADGQPEPAAWTVEAATKEELESGKSSVWCAPFSNTPAAVDDVTIQAVP